jgi:hypothetical protein
MPAKIKLSNSLNIQKFTDTVWKKEEYSNSYKYLWRSEN